MTSLMRRIITTNLHREYKCGRKFHKSARCAGTDRTTATVLNKQIDSGLLIDSVSAAGFELNNGMTIVGPMAIFPKTVISWNIAKSSDMHEEALSLFLVLEPKIDILVIGLDNIYPHTAPFLQNVREILRAANLKHEILQTKEACAAFNFLNCDSRYVVGALIPPRTISTEMRKLDSIREERLKIKEYMNK